MKLEECRKCPCYAQEIDAGTLRCSFWNKTDLRLIVREEGMPPRVVVCPLLTEQRDYRPHPFQKSREPLQPINRRENSYTYMPV